MTVIEMLILQDKSRKLVLHLSEHRQKKKMADEQMNFGC